MQKSILFCVCLFSAKCLANGSGSSLDFETDIADSLRTIPEMTVPQLINYWGYPVEEHFVTTEDGYILGLHRIPQGRGERQSDAPRPVAYLQHCLTCSSAVWTFGPPEKSLGYVLADAGYDVWMGNSRGNTYSRNHTTLEVCAFERCKEFWDFDWHEGGLYDVTAGIDYVLAATGESQVNYVGYSMGCTQYMVTLSMRPEYNEKIRVGAMLAPPVFMNHATSPLFQLANIAGDIEILYHIFGFYEFLPHYDIISWFAHMFCSDEHPIYQDLCMNIAFVILGFDPDKLNGTMIPTYLDHLPEGTTTRTAVHYVQLYFSGNFEAYDFGTEGNLVHYQQETPPVYDLSKVVAPTAIFKADADDLSDLVDVDRLVNTLPNVVYDHLVEKDGWTHFDYAAAVSADDLVYDYVVDVFAQYNF